MHFKIYLILRGTYTTFCPLGFGLFWFSKSLVTLASNIKDFTSSSLPKIIKYPINFSKKTAEYIVEPIINDELFAIFYKLSKEAQLYNKS